MPDKPNVRSKHSIASVSITAGALLVYFADGERVIVNSELLRSLPSDQDIEEQLLQYDAELEAYDA